MKVEDCISTYLAHCKDQKRLDEKTIRAYQNDLKQFKDYISFVEATQVEPSTIEGYISRLNQQYKARTVRRKIASTKAFFRYLEYKEIIPVNPFNKLQIKLREPINLPKTIPLSTVKQFLETIYGQIQSANTPARRKKAIKDAAVCELLFATGMRISELCSLKQTDIDFSESSILIYGKGAKERKMQIGSPDVLSILKKYKETYKDELSACDHFFVSSYGTPLSDQAVRRMLNKYTEMASIEQHITPHMFRHTFASSLLDADVDIRYIQEMLGHSSIHTTEIYTHVAMSKQMDILTNKHPRNLMEL